MDYELSLRVCSNCEARRPQEKKRTWTVTLRDEVKRQQDQAELKGCQGESYSGYVYGQKASQEAKDWVEEKVKSKETPDLSREAKTWIQTMTGSEETQDTSQWAKDRLDGVAEFKMPQESIKIDGAGDEIQDEITNKSRFKIRDMRYARNKTRLDEEDWLQSIGSEAEANQARAEWIKQAKIDELTDKLEDFYECPGGSDRFSGLADEQIRMIASWLPTRSWQTILPTINSHAQARYTVKNQLPNAGRTP